MKYKKEMKLKGVEVESAPPPPQSRHCSSPLQLGGAGAHSRECGRGEPGRWAGRGGPGEGRPGWGSAGEFPGGGAGRHSGHSCHQSHHPTLPAPAAAAGKPQVGKYGART